MTSPAREQGARDHEDDGDEPTQERLARTDWERRIYRRLTDTSAASW